MLQNCSGRAVLQSTGDCSMGWVAVTSQESRPSPKVFRARFDPSQVRDQQQILQTVSDGSAQIADARPSGRFTAEEPEPREGMRSGHMPGARNVPFPDLLDNGRLNSYPSEIRTWGVTFRKNWD